MASSHLKRIVAPKTWPILRKTTTFVSRPKPNGQKMELTLPVVIVMREMLGVVENATQARRILRTQEVTVNGTRIYDTDSAVGFMDVLSINKKHYRILINQNNSLTVIPVKDDEAFTIQKIVGKTQIKGKTQLNCASGRTVLVPKDEYKVGSSISIEGGKIKAHLPLENGASVLLTSGSHIGKVGTIESIEGNTITIKTGEETVQTAKTHAYVIGKGKPAITL